MERCHTIRKRGKSGPMYIGHFKASVRVGRVAYHLVLLDESSHIHKTFNVSQLWKCLVDDSVMVPLEYIQVDDRLNYIETLVAILDRKTKT